MRQGRGVQRPRSGGPLRTNEIVEAALLADLAVGLRLFGRLIPVAWPFVVAATLPLAVLAVRHRPRAAIMATLVATMLAFLVGGTSLAPSMFGLGILGLAVGTAVRHGWGRARATVMAVLCVGIPASVVAVCLLAIFSSLRRLTLEQTRISWRGTAKILRRFNLDAIANAGMHAVDWIIAHWWIAIPIAMLVATAVTAVAAHALAVGVVNRLTVASGPRRVVPPDDPRPAGPVPVSFVDVGYRYPGADHDALADLNLTLPAAALIAVVGDNGSGKSTLARLLTGVTPTHGTVERPGSAAFGHDGGTALVAQRPESQVLGVRVADDIRWGLPRDADIDVAGLLDTVGLSGFEERETSTLSGGQLQRLAIAAALARRPGLLVCDEATSMLDPDGRREVVELLSRLVARGLTVVHITHRSDEAVHADLVVRLGHGRIVAVGAPHDVLDRERALVAPTNGNGAAAGAAPRPLIAPVDGALLRFEGAGLVYAAGTPWAHEALIELDLSVDRAEGMVVVGDNGSGKSTLAWLAAGLLAPTTGSVTFAGRPSYASVGRVGVAFQHARLQLFRATVARDVAYGLPDGRDGVDAALRAVELDPLTIGHRHVDALSGGQQRRVALAGLLARRPKLLVLDEPLAGLDEPGRERLIATLARLRHDHGVATVIVTHDHDIAHRLGERVVRLVAGRVAHDGGLRDAGGARIDMAEGGNGSDGGPSRSHSAGTPALTSSVPRQQGGEPS